ncbi:HYC_CC_PP family protein [Mucilaginibacter arboris]|uniref:Uncharacterized protein n=1 Tax=Mucilaginibacter arboris TaxID=2682090 RepID=A0A7K1SS22_9SPHI|nr:hypothetical protein [Mucilaginibacter arboris]MVN20103.1 hypothetical protein [Mucilaginibacter arboris]
MLKRSGIVLVVLLYLVTATGFALNLHFCGNSIESVKIDGPTKKCGMDSKCCKNTHLEVKVKDAHQAVHASFTGKNLVFLVPVLSYASSQELLTINQFANPVPDRGPPHLNSVPVFVKNCTFRI